MKTKIEIVILIIIFLLSSYLIYNFVESDTKNIVTNEEIKFKEEYEKLNGVYNEKLGKYYPNVEVIENSNVTYKDEKEIIDILTTGTGIIYFGFPECPWCRNLLPVLIDVVNEYGVQFNYYNAYDIRDNKHLDEQNQIVIDKNGTDEYYKIVEILGDFLSEYKGLNDPSIKRLYFPTVVFVKDGKIISAHIGTISSQKDPFVLLDSEQREELFGILESYLVKTFDIVCDENC